jgi:hypothetical protein
VAGDWDAEASGTTGADADAEDSTTGAGAGAGAEADAEAEASWDFLDFLGAGEDAGAEAGTEGAGADTAGAVSSAFALRATVFAGLLVWLVLIVLVLAEVFDIIKRDLFLGCLPYLPGLALNFFAGCELFFANESYQNSTPVTWATFFFEYPFDP